MSEEYQCEHCGHVGQAGYGHIIIGRNPAEGPWCKYCGLRIYNQPLEPTDKSSAENKN